MNMAMDENIRLIFLDKSQIRDKRGRKNIGLILRMGRRPMTMMTDHNRRAREGGRQSLDQEGLRRAMHQRCLLGTESFPRSLLPSNQAVVIEAFQGCPHR